MCGLLVDWPYLAFEFSGNFGGYVALLSTEKQRSPSCIICILLLLVGVFAWRRYPWHRGAKWGGVHGRFIVGASNCIFWKYGKIGEEHDVGKLYPCHQEGKTNMILQPLGLLADQHLGLPRGGLGVDVEPVCVHGCKSGLSWCLDGIFTLCLFLSFRKKLPQNSAHTGNVGYKHTQTIFKLLVGPSYLLLQQVEKR